MGIVTGHANYHEVGSHWQNWDFDLQVIWASGLFHSSSSSAPTAPAVILNHLLLYLIHLEWNTRFFLPAFWIPLCIKTTTHHFLFLSTTVIDFSPCYSFCLCLLKLPIMFRIEFIISGSRQRALNRLMKLIPNSPRSFTHVFLCSDFGFLIFWGQRRREFGAYYMFVTLSYWRKKSLQKRLLRATTVMTNHLIINFFLRYAIIYPLM